MKVLNKNTTACRHSREGEKCKAFIETFGKTLLSKSSRSFKDYNMINIIVTFFVLIQRKVTKEKSRRKDMQHFPLSALIGFCSVAFLAVEY
jgi:hypothetical protein